MKNRNKNIDLLKGIAIILMVFDHVGWYDAVHVYIQSFHMPLFFLVSGYLWKKSELKERTIVRAKKLLIPYYSMSFIYFLIAAIFTFLRIKQFNIIKMLCTIFFLPTDMNNMPFAPALWFLPCMFLTDFIYNFISLKAKEKTKHIIVLIIAILGSVYSHFDFPILPFGIEPVCAALLFFDIGYVFNKYKIKKHFNNNYLLFLLFMVIHIVLTFLNIGSVDMRSARFNIVPLYFINGCLGTFAYSYGVQLIKSLKIQNMLAWFGKNTMQFLCFNQFFIMIFQNLISNIIRVDAFFSQIMSNMLIFICSILSSIIIGSVISKTKMKFLIGKY